ncbi:MAG: cell filamentation protein Fic, partial [Verrucomicrobia bacterium]|nr:cell filamentation protein Fic [Verrucomicrobiota bacterium]
MFINDFKNFGVTSAPASQKRPAGYAYLVEKYQLAVIPNWHISYIGENESFWYVIQGNQVEETYPAQYWPGEDDATQLQFALRHDTVNLGILSALFEVIPNETLLQCVRKHNQEDWCRVLWFLYEFLTNKRLELPDLTEGEEVPVLDPRLFYTLTPGEFIPRQRVLNNLTGDAVFCPLIRRTDKLT